MEDDPRLREARKHVENLKAFYIHGIVFIVVMSGLFVINVATGGPWWVHWPLLGWGIGLAGHALTLFKPMTLFGKEWTEKQIKTRLDKG